MEINAEVADNPALLRQDPYGKGWLVPIHVPDEESTTRNLVPKGLVREWMREAVGAPVCPPTALWPGQLRPMAAARPKICWRALPDANWKEVTGEFFLTA